MRITELRGPGNHRITNQQLDSEAQSRLQEMELDDAELWSFRITGRLRFWCVKTENIFSLLWWDPNHQICPSLRS